MKTGLEFMKRRTFLRSLAASAIVGAASTLPAFATLPKMKITRVRAYLPPNPNPLFNQSDVVVTIETDAGITGVGEGGSKDMLSQSAGRLIGRDPQYIEQLWQDMNRPSSIQQAARRPTPSALLIWPCGILKEKFRDCPYTSY
jgi:hypothetical protein